MNRRRKGAEGPPLWPLAEAARSRMPVAGWWRAPTDKPSSTQPELPANDGSESARRAALIEARARLASALKLLDLHSRSPAAANVDLAIHQIDQELGS